MTGNQKGPTVSTAWHGRMLSTLSDVPNLSRSATLSFGSGGEKCVSISCDDCVWRGMART
jgi:hypothetical protein